MIFHNFLVSRVRPFNKSSWIKSHNKTSIASSTIVLPSTGKNNFNSKKVLLSPLLMRFSNFSCKYIHQTNLDFEWYSDGPISTRLFPSNSHKVCPLLGYSSIYITSTGPPFFCQGIQRGKMFHERFCVSLGATAAVVLGSLFSLWRYAHSVLPCWKKRLSSWVPKGKRAAGI